jgi:hypothetical protein
LFVGALANPFGSVELAFPFVGQLELDELVGESFCVALQREQKGQSEERVNLFHISRLWGWFGLGKPKFSIPPG